MTVSVGIGTDGAIPALTSSPPYLNGTVLSGAAFGGLTGAPRFRKNVAKQTD
jgi:hypothetical protein